MKFNSRYKIKTNSGYKDFIGVRRNINTGLIIYLENNTIKCTTNHLILVGSSKSGKIFRQAKKIKVGHKISGNVVLSIQDDKKQYYYDPVEVRGDNTYLSGDVVHHNCAVIDEAAFIRHNQWNEFIDSFLPSQSALAWKKNIILSTPKGMNHYFDLVKGASPYYETDGSGVKAPGEYSNGYKLFKVDWRDVPRYDKDGDLIPPEEFEKNIIKKHGEMYFLQNFKCSFLGSSHTLLSSDTLRSLQASHPINKLTPGLKIYSKPLKGHQYIMAVDAAKDGTDSFAIQIVDITGFKFEQVASAKLDVDYLIMPEIIDEWVRMYNNAFLIIENNEGAGQSVADQLFLTHEYENLYFDKSRTDRKRKKYPGFRTTPKSRKLILQTMKTFIENNNLIINDQDTINEFFTFILDKGKYQADEGSHDDMIMSLAIVFAPFCNSKNFEDMQKVIEILFRNHEDSDDIEVKDVMVIGGFDDATEENANYSRDYNSIEEYYGDQDGFY